MYIHPNSRTEEHSSSIDEHHYTPTSNSESSFEERLIKKQEAISQALSVSHSKTIKEQEDKCIKRAEKLKIQKKMCEKVEKYLSKKMEEERSRVKIMIQVLNDISKIFPYMMFHSNLRNKI